MRKAWSDAELSYLVLLAESGHTFSEMASELGRGIDSVKTKVFYLRTRLGLKIKIRNPIIKYESIRRDVMLYFQTHSFEETAKHFSLSKNQLKSLATNAYMRRELSHIRKDTRCKREWDAHDIRMMLKFSGLMPRVFIAKRLKRSKFAHHSVKDQLRKMNIQSRQVNGLTLQQFRTIFQKDTKAYILTKAGPSGGTRWRTKGQFHWKIIPYVEIDRMLRAKELSANKTLRLAFRSMAMFQRWIWQDKNLTLAKIKKEMRGLIS